MRPFIETNQMNELEVEEGKEKCSQLVLWSSFVIFLSLSRSPFVNDRMRGEEEKSTPTNCMENSYEEVC